MPDRWPLDEAFTAERLAATVRELDERDAADCETLLHDLLCAAWPTREAQNQ